MAQGNFVQIVGTAGGDPELRFTTSGIAVCSFSVAWTPRKKDAHGEWTDGDTCWFRCTAWRDLGENIAASVTKGMRLIVTGSVKARDWEDKDGNKRTSIEIDVEECSPSLMWAQAQVERTERTKTTTDRPAGPPAAPAGGTSGHGYDYPDEEPFMELATEATLESARRPHSIALVRPWF